MTGRANMFRNQSVVRMPTLVAHHFAFARPARQTAGTLAVMIGAALPFAALAADAPAEFEACMNAAQSTPAYTECSRTEMERQDKLLNAAWRAAAEKMKAFNLPSFNLLLNEQRKWIQWKESACQYYQDGFGSEGKSVQYPMCFIKILRDRVAYLHDLADQL